MSYDHTQTAPLYLLLAGIGAPMLVGGWYAPEWTVQLIMMSAGGLMLLSALCFRQLNVSDEDDRLVIQFGPIPLFRRHVLYADIESAERSRSTLLDGWGIHMSLSGGWVWNLWGFDCVDVFMTRGRKLRLGTDDPEGLEAFLKRRLGQEDT